MLSYMGDIMIAWLLCLSAAAFVAGGNVGS